MRGVPLVVIQRQLGHANLGITSVYLQGIDSAEIIDTVHSRPRRLSPPRPASQADKRTGHAAGHQPAARSPRVRAFRAREARSRMSVRSRMPD